MFTLSRTQDVVHRGAHALLHHSGALETRPCDVFGDGAYKRPCACVIFPVSTFPVCSFDGLYISFTHSSMFVLLYLFDARHVGGVGWGGVGGMFTFAVTPLTMLFRLCLFLVYLSDGWGGVGWGVGGMFTFAVTPLTMLFRLCLFLVYLSDGLGGVGWGVGGMFTFAVTPLTMLFRLCLFLVYLSDGLGGVGWGVGGMFTFAVTPLTMLFRLCLLFLMFAVTPLTSYFALIY